MKKKILYGVLSTVMFSVASVDALEVTETGLHTKPVSSIEMSFVLNEESPICYGRAESAGWPKTVYGENIELLSVGSEGNGPDRSIRVLKLEVPEQSWGEAKQVSINCYGETGAVSYSETFPALPKFSVQSLLVVENGLMNFTASTYVDNQESGGHCMIRKAPGELDLWGNSEDQTWEFWADYFSSSISITEGEVSVFQTVVDCTNSSGTSRHDRVWVIEEGVPTLVYDETSYLISN